MWLTTGMMHVQISTAIELYLSIRKPFKIFIYVIDLLHFGIGRFTSVIALMQSAAHSGSSPPHISKTSSTHSLASSTSKMDDRCDGHFNSHASLSNLEPKKVASGSPPSSCNSNPRSPNSRCQSLESAQGTESVEQQRNFLRQMVSNIPKGAKIGIRQVSPLEHLAQDTSVLKATFVSQVKAFEVIRLILRLPGGSLRPF